MQNSVLHKGFIIVLEEDEAGWFTTHVPGLPGCISQGLGLAAALENISSAIDDYLEIQPTRGGATSPLARDRINTPRTQDER